MAFLVRGITGDQVVRFTCESTADAAGKLLEFLQAGVPAFATSFTGQILSAEDLLQLVDSDAADADPRMTPHIRILAA